MVNNRVSNQVTLSVSFYNAIYSKALAADAIEKENIELKERLMKMESINKDDEKIRPSTYDRIYNEGKNAFMKTFQDFKSSQYPRVK